MATAPLKSAAGAQGTIRMLADGICRPQVVHILTERPESVVEHRRDEAVVLFEERGAANSTSVPLITLPESDVARANPAGSSRRLRTRQSRGGHRHVDHQIH